MIVLAAAIALLLPTPVAPVSCRDISGVWGRTYFYSDGTTEIVLATAACRDLAKPRPTNGAYVGVLFHEFEHAWRGTRDERLAECDSLHHLREWSRRAWPRLTLAERNWLYEGAWAAHVMRAYARPEYGPCTYEAGKAR